MEPMVAGWLMIAVVIGLLVLGLPVAFAMFIAGAIGLTILVGYQNAILSIPIVFYDKMSMGSLMVVPSSTSLGTRGG